MVRRRKIKFYITMKKWEQLQLTLDNAQLEAGQRTICIKHKHFFQGNEGSRYWIWNFHRFFSEGTHTRVWFLQCLQQEFVWISILWVFKLSRFNCVYEFAKFLPKIRYNPSKIIEELIFPLFLIISPSVLVIIETSIKKIWLKQVIKETKMKKKFI